MGEARAESRFRLPEESAPHEATFMQWPVSREVYPDADFLADVQGTIADVANTVVAFEPVAMLMAGEHRSAAQRLLSADVEIWDVPTEDLWCRDSGPQFVVDGGGHLAVSQLNFNGWGGKQVHREDGRVAERVGERLGVPVIDSGIVGEGGGVEADGAGTLIAHASCWVNPNRNVEDRAAIEERLLEALGATTMVWAPGLVGRDITDDHIDSLARFVRPGVVAIQMPDESDGDIWARRARETYRLLADATDARRRRLELVTIPDPYDTRVTGDDFVAAYVNYYVCNGAVVMAAFGDRDADAEAQATVARLYPGREVVTLNADALGEVGGGVHCATREMPATG